MDLLNENTLLQRNSLLKFECFYLFEIQPAKSTESVYKRLEMVHLIAIRIKKINRK